MIVLDQFSYHLPKSFIAQKPTEPRDVCKLLLLNRKTGAIQHKHFFDLPSLLNENDVLVRNNSKVIPARLFGLFNGKKKCEVLLLKKVATKPDEQVWEALTRPGLKPNDRVSFAGANGKIIIQATCIKQAGYTRILSFPHSHTDLFNYLDRYGNMPIPPYIHPDLSTEQRLRTAYQTTYAKDEGSVAAPTAGLHFTPRLDQQLQERGIQIHELTLHVGLGTFLPVKSEDITQHTMHSEWFTLSDETAKAINAARAEQRRIIAVGTTTVRVLESCYSEASQQFVAKIGETNMYIYPPYRFHCVDAMITNFHLPHSTLLMLISAFCSDPTAPGKPFTTFQSSLAGMAYEEAKRHQYRFYSFGDVMLIE